ncbi:MULTISPECIES: hypothetical protein [Rhizobium]|uniref:Transcriptional regulator n=1 Tax=Rhizobium rhododendri TaxID=2506430 RepID=A0ABY8IKH2_9HYPH|nr:MULTISPECIES: hypothetical protein [Rhizobium]MBO9097923.1 hypothetical protein [Rhizobium sp. L58/93]MBO9133294.1 hypothetical protein [Rhizobium sp. B209b/85]MBO9168074.1 hypothetical protein [Rhizobium sp. L245/93]MBO9184119.1 hypothetical protein [Rhizobium sp. E27B/91]MBZ5760190.1 hypothetical protein [Rhizobium sp. VS19-DR96]
MSTVNTSTTQPAKTDLASLYRPIGLKAVTAAHLMLKGKSATSKKIA